ncbi:MAG TPA: peptidoglycan-binding protein [Bryobacteraceae bacterium]|nr:peptidoglycan-binding protein [Bryobacteraceae bacterium]
MTDLQRRTIQAIVNVFETGRIQGRYDAITLLVGDPGHLTYGRSQTTLASGNLYLLIKAYCDAPNAQFAAQFAPFLDRLRNRDMSLDTDLTLRAVLREAGSDAVMEATQDAFFERAYFVPSCNAAAAAQITSGLGQAVVYDSFIQGGWRTVQQMVTGQAGAIGNGTGEQDWVTRYVNARRSWLLSLRPPLPSTVYRMDSFSGLITQNKWQLELPLSVHGVAITEAALAPGASVAVRASVDGNHARILDLETPNLTGGDVTALQQALGARGFPVTVNGIFSAATDARVREFQRSCGLVADGVVGPQTRGALGID